MENSLPGYGPASYYKVTYEHGFTPKCDLRHSAPRQKAISLMRLGRLMPSSHGCANQERKAVSVGVVSTEVFYREIIGELLAGSKDFVVVMKIPTVSDYFSAVNQSPPKILIVYVADVAQGLAAVDWLRHLPPDLRILLLTDEPKDAILLQALGARGWDCLSTSEGVEALLMALEKLAHGERGTGRGLPSSNGGEAGVGRRAPAGFAEPLTLLEWNVLELLANGCPTRKVARCLGIDAETASSHLKSVYTKLQVTNRVAAAIRYFEYFQGQRCSPSKVNAQVGVH